MRYSMGRCCTLFALAGLLWGCAKVEVARPATATATPSLSSETPSYASQPAVRGHELAGSPEPAGGLELAGSPEPAGGLPARATAIPATTAQALPAREPR